MPPFVYRGGQQESATLLDRARRSARRQTHAFLFQTAAIDAGDVTPTHFDELRRQLWPVVRPWINEAQDDADLGLAFSLVHRAFMWAARNSHTMPDPKRSDEVSMWLEAGLLADLQGMESFLPCSSEDVRSVQSSSERTLQQAHRG